MGEIMKLTVLKEKVLKFFIIFTVCISLSQGPAASREIDKMLECLSGARDQKMCEIDEDEINIGEPEKADKCIE